MVASKLVMMRNPEKRFRNMDEMCKLIRLYQANESLWNPKSPGYDNLKLKENAWHRISLFFKDRLTVDELKLQMLSLRCYYEAERTIIERSKQSGFEYMPRHPYYKKLEFLNDLEMDNDNSIFSGTLANVYDDQINCIVEDALLLSNSESSIHSEQVDFQESFTLDEDCVINNFSDSLTYSQANHCMSLPLPTPDIEVERLNVRIVSGNDEWYEQSTDPSYRRHTRSVHHRVHHTYSNDASNYIHQHKTFATNICDSPSNDNMPQSSEWTDTRDDSQPKKKVLTGRYRSSSIEPNRNGHTTGNKYESVTQKLHQKLLNGKANLYETNLSRNTRDILRKPSGEDTLNPKNNPFYKYVKPSGYSNSNPLPYIKQLKVQNGKRLKPDSRQIQNQQQEYNDATGNPNEDNCEGCEGYCTIDQRQYERKQQKYTQAEMSEDFHSPEQTSDDYGTTPLVSEYADACDDETCPNKENWNRTEAMKGNQDYENQNQFAYENQEQTAYDKQQDRRTRPKRTDNERESFSQRRRQVDTEESSEEMLKVTRTAKSRAPSAVREYACTSKDPGNDTRLECPAVKRGRRQRNEFDDDQAEYLECPEERRKQRSRSGQPQQKQYVESPTTSNRRRSSDDRYEQDEYRARSPRNSKNDARENPRRCDAYDNEENYNEQIEQNRYAERSEPRQRRQQRDEEPDEYCRRNYDRSGDRTKCSRNRRDRAENYPNDQAENRRYSDEYDPNMSRRQRNSDSRQTDCDACCRPKSTRNKPEYSEYRENIYRAERAPRNYEAKQNDYEEYSRNYQNTQEEYNANNNDPYSKRDAYENDNEMPENKNEKNGQGEMDCFCQKTQPIEVCRCEAAVETDLDMSLNNRNDPCLCQDNPPYADPTTKTNDNSQAKNDNQNEIEAENVNEETNKEKLVNRTKKIGKMCRCTPAQYSKNKPVKPPVPAAKPESGKNRAASPIGGKSKSKRSNKFEEESSNEFQANEGRQWHSAEQENNQDNKHKLNRPLSGCDGIQTSYNNHLRKPKPIDTLAMLCSIQEPPSAAQRTMKILNNHISNVIPFLIEKNFKEKVKSLKKPQIHLLSESRWRQLLAKAPLPKTSQYAHNNPFRNINFNASKREVIILHPPVLGFRPSKYSLNMHEEEVAQFSD